MPYVICIVFPFLPDGFKFYRSANNVILCPGNEQGFLPSCYFQRVVQTRPSKFCFGFLKFFYFSYNNKIRRSSIGKITSWYSIKTQEMYDCWHYHYFILNEVQLRFTIGKCIKFTWVQSCKPLYFPLLNVIYFFSRVRGWYRYINLWKQEWDLL